MDFTEALLNEIEKQTLGLTSISSQIFIFRPPHVLRAGTIDAIRNQLHYSIPPTRRTISFSHDDAIIPYVT